MSEEKPRVGIGVMILKDWKVLMSLRKGSHGEGEWQFPGGHLEFGESFERCAVREVKEETDIEIENVRFQFLANVKKYANKHYVHIGLIADYKSGKVKNTEPEKSGEWGWFEFNNLPQPIFEMCKIAFESRRTGQNYFDS